MVLKDQIFTSNNFLGFLERDLGLIKIDGKFFTNKLLKPYSNYHTMCRKNILSFEYKLDTTQNQNHSIETTQLTTK